MMRLWGRVLGPVVLLPVLVFGGVALFGTTRVEPESWTPPVAPPVDSGPYAPSVPLTQAQVFGQDNLFQAEALALGPDGKLYAGLANGDIVRMQPDHLNQTDKPQTAPHELVVNTGGRPFGMAFHPNGLLIVADGAKGLLSVDVSGENTTNRNPIEVLSTASDGVDFRFTNDVALSADGRYAYFTDASHKFGVKEFVLDLLEHRGNGRFLEYDFETGKTRTLIGNLQFANGVEMSPKGDFVLINETGMYQIRRYWLKGPKAGKHDVLIDNLPGFPDNIRADSAGNFWIALPSLRDGLIDGLADRPAVRKAVGRLLEVIEFPVKPCVFILAVNAQGEIKANLQAEKVNGFYYVTQVTPVGRDLFLSSVTVKGIAKVPNPLLK